MKEENSLFQMSKEMHDFIKKLDSLCFDYGYEIWPTDKINAKNKDGSYPTMTIHGKKGEKIKLICIDGDFFENYYNLKDKKQ